MRKLSFLALVLALLLAVTACASPSGLLLKEATLKQTDLDSYESMTTFSLDMDTLMMKNSFNLDVYAKQVNLLNTLSKIYVSPELLALAGLELNSGKKASLDMIMKDGDFILTSSEDQVGIQLMNMFAMPEGEELPFKNKEELEAWLVTIQDKMREVFTAYLADYDFSLEQIRDLGQKTISLPNGSKVDTAQIQIELSVLDLLDMLHYSLNHFVNDAEFQEAFYNMMVDMTLLEEGKTSADVTANEVAKMKKELQQEINPAVQEMAKELEKFIAEELSKHEQVILEAASFVIDTYVGVNDQQIYQQDYRLNLTYTEELSKLDVEETADVPLVPGDSVSFTMSQQIWNHNKKLEPVAVPATLISIEDIEQMESVEEFKQVAGENSLLAQIAEQFMGFMGEVTEDLNLSFVELKVAENKMETMDEEQAVHLYTKDGQLMAPLALIGEAMGAEVTWNAENRQVEVSTADHQLVVDTANDYYVQVDGEVRGDIKVEIIDGTSYVNVRAFAEAMGWEVLWMEETHSALIMN